VHRRQKHFFKIEDARRILDRLVPPDNEEGDTWAQKVINVLREATIRMLDRILPFLSSYQIEGLYEFCRGILDKFFDVAPTQEPAGKIRARSLIIYIADRAGLEVTIKG